MGSYGGVKICQLVDLYVLSWLQNLNINVGLIKGQGIFKEKGLKIAVEAKTKVVKLSILRTFFAQVYTNLTKTDSYNYHLHPLPKLAPTRNHQKLIELLLSTNSANAEIFRDPAKHYDDALKIFWAQKESKVHQQENKP